MKQLTLKHWFGIWSLLILAFIFILTPDEWPLKTNKRGFHVNESDELRFKNLRQFYYNKQIDPISNYDIFRSKKSSAENKSIRFAIVNNWLQNSAYILVEPWPIDSTAIYVFKNDFDSIRFEYGKLNVSEQLKISQWIYNQKEASGLQMNIYKTKGGCEKII